MVASSAHPRAQSGPATSTPGRAGAPVGSRVDFIAVTRNDALLEQIGQALDGESAIRHAETTEAAVELVRATTACVVLLDSVGHADLGPLIEKLQAPDGHSVVVVFAPAEQNEDVARSIKASATFAVLPVPIETAKTAAVLEGARDEAMSRRDIAASPPPTKPAASMPQAAPVPPAVRPAKPATPASRVHRASDLGNVAGAPARADLAAHRGPPRPVIIGAAACLAMLLAVVGWLALRGDEDRQAATEDREAATPTASAGQSADAVPVAPPDAGATTGGSVTASNPVPDAIEPGSVDDLLEKARVAIRERRYSAPDGDNALTYYRSVLAQEPDNGEALEGLARIGVVLDGRLKSAMGERRLDEAAQALAQLRLVRPGDPALKTHETSLAEAQVTAALEANDTDRASALLRRAVQAGSLPADRAAHLQAQLDRRRASAQVDALVELVAKRIREGRLVEPASDSAKHYYARLRKLADNSQQTAAAQRDLQAAYLQRARAAGTQKKSAEVDRWLAEARVIGASAASIAAARREASATPPAKSAGPDVARLSKLIQERLSDGRLLEPPQDSAVFHLGALRSADPAAAAGAAASVSARLLTEGHGALADGRLEDARRFAVAARALGLDAGAVEALETDIAAAQSRIAAMPVQVTADQVTRTRFVAPMYPSKALAKDISGKVTLRYTIGKDGRIKDAVVTDSNPAGMFDAAAVAAVQRWRYKPYEVDGSAVEATLMTVMKFTPDDETDR